MAHCIFDELEFSNSQEENLADDLDMLFDLNLSDFDVNMFLNDWDPSYADGNVPLSMEEPLMLSEDLQPTSNPNDSILNNTSIDNLNDWVIQDQTTNRLRPPRLFEFLILLLRKPNYSCYASFTNKSEGIFQINEPEKVAQLWEQIKSRQSKNRMTYDKFARAIRWYYKYGIFQKTNTRYTFQFSPQALQMYFHGDENDGRTFYYSNMTEEMME